MSKAKEIRDYYETEDAALAAMQAVIKLQSCWCAEHYDTACSVSYSHTPAAQQLESVLRTLTQLQHQHSSNPPA